MCAFIDIIRLEYTPTEILGVLMINKQVFCYTLEPPEKNNLKGESCILPGQYVAKRYDSKKFGVPCIALYNVPGRDNISIHYGNTHNDTKGCILVGVKTGYLTGKRALFESKNTLAALMMIVKSDAHVSIKNYL